ncbi:hypothetical protein MLD38_038534 [Melastoma candidum]|uniref:Uncharacterized protein n=1 Tax=Melastoma candidum TaxID=119954 RepID=A0ACB9L1H9_9MYRT|nr:hypothetical protein MLD38_038534 [Melastoma candidum]
MLARRALPLLTSPRASQFSKLAAKSGEVAAKGGGTFVRKAVSFLLITVTGGVALSALDDLAIYHACSSQAMEKAAKNQAIKDALGEPIVKGPWYNASLAVAHKRHSVSCTFPVLGPQGSGIVQLKAVRNEDDAWFSFLRPRNWEVLVMEALLHVPGNEEKQRTFRINVANELPPPTCKECVTCPSPGVATIEPEKSSANV